jgi:hypothetical protein
MGIQREILYPPAVSPGCRTDSSVHSINAFAIIEGKSDGPTSLRLGAEGEIRGCSLLG